MLERLAVLDQSGAQLRPLATITTNTNEHLLQRRREASAARTYGRPDRSEVVCSIQFSRYRDRSLLTPRSSLRSALKEFFDPLRTNDPRTDFFAVYRKESVEFDRDYAKKYDEDLNTSLIFVSRLISTFATQH